jgi:hypothetical protein
VFEDIGQLATAATVLVVHEAEARADFRPPTHLVKHCHRISVQHATEKVARQALDAIDLREASRAAGGRADGYREGRERAGKGG